MFFPYSQLPVLDTDAELSLRAAIDEANAAKQVDYRERLDRMRTDAVVIWGSTSNEYKYLEKKSIGYSQNLVDSWVSNYNWRYDNEVKAEAERKRKLAAAAAQREAFLTQANAKWTKWLITIGKELGTDFEFEDAMKYGVRLKMDELKESDDLHDFSGNNCDDCPGWDGEERRCECGNRRVSWEYEGQDDPETFYAYGQAW